MTALSLRLSGLDAHHFWHDELLALDYARGAPRSGGPVPMGYPFRASDFEGGLGGTVRSVSESGGNGILYYLALNRWLLLAGRAEFAARLPSALLGVAVVGFGLLLGLQLLPTPVAWRGAFLLAIHPLLLRYSQETRAYALATSLSLLAGYAFVMMLRAERPRASRWWSLFFGTAAACAFLSHYLTVGILLAFLLFAIPARHRTAGLHTRLILASVPFCVLVTAWVVLGVGDNAGELIALNAQYQQEAPQTDRPVGLPSSPHSVAAGMTQSVLAASGNGLQAAGFRVRELLWLVPAPLFLATCGVLSLRRQRKADAALLLALCGLSGPTLSLFHAILSGHTVLFQVLYVNFATPFFILLIAAGMMPRPGSPIHFVILGRTAGATVVACMIASLPFVYWDTPWCRGRVGPFARVARMLEISAHSESEVVHSSWGVAKNINLRLPVDWPIQQHVDPQSTPSAVALLSLGRCVWSLETDGRLLSRPRRFGATYKTLGRE